MPIERKTDKHRAKDGSSPEKIHPKGEKISSGKNPDLIRIKPRIPLKIKVLPLQVTTPTLQARRGKDIPYTLERKRTLPSPRPLVHCRHAPCTPVRGQRLTRRRSPQTPLPRLPTGKSDRTAPETKKQALRMGEPATDRRIYRYGQETAHTVPVIQINFKT